MALPYALRSYPPGRYLLREGDQPRHCSLLLDGFAYRQKLIGDGGRQIVSVHVPGDPIDLQNLLLETADHNVQSLTPVSIAAIDKDTLLAVAFARPAVGKAMWRESLIEASIFREWVANVGRRDARARTAHLLCELALLREEAGLGPRDHYELPMTQEQLADALGLTAVHINRTLKVLQDDGLIGRHKRSVTVIDWERLRATADFRSTYLHIDT